MTESELSALYATYGRRIYNYVLWLTRNRSSADDIAQSVFIKAWRQPGPFASEVECERWLFTVAKNACLDLFRSRKRQTELRERFARSQPLFSKPSVDEGHAWDLLEVLSAEERSVVYLHIKMGYNYKEIGRLLDMNENAVRVKAFRAFRRLREKALGAIHD